MNTNPLMMKTSDPFTATRPVNHDTKFVEGTNFNTYKSFNDEPLSVGQIVYQMSNLEGTYTPILREFTITELLRDGRIKIEGSILINNTMNKNTLQVHPSNVHTDAKELVKYYLANLKHKMQVEYVHYHNGLIKIMLELDPHYDTDNLIVGEGITEKTEI